MFIDWSQQLSLLEHNPEAHILKDFSLSVRKVLVSQVVTFLLENNGKKVLSSPSHVTWAMETVGEGFCLPIEEAESITKVITLYTAWSLEPAKRPDSFNANPQFFIQRVLEHFSLLFEPRAKTKETIEKHAHLCGTVLDIFINIGRKIGDSLSEETWEIFLRLLLGISDLILRPEAPSDQEVLQGKLCPQLLKVLFELWLLSRTRNPVLWEALKQCVRRWTQHKALVLTWKLTCIALTKRSVAILYGPSEGTDSVIISIDDSIQKLNLEDEYVFYSWHRMINLVGNPSATITVPGIFIDFMKGIEILVNQYLKIGYSKGQESSRFIAPTGNTILHIFGTWLFDAIHLNRSGFDEGTSLAVRTLCAMMATKHQTNFLPIYSSNFFSSLQSALAGEGRVLVTAIVSFNTLFTSDIKGIRCLVPSFIDAIYRICTNRAKLSDVMPPEHVRRACFVILGAIISFPNQFSSTKFFLQNSISSQMIAKATNYSELKPHISAILIETLDIETSDTNIQTLLHLIFVWQYETIRDSSDFTKKSIKLILRKVKQNQWHPVVTCDALRSLTEMSIHYPSISKSVGVASNLVDILCRFITTLGNPCPPNQDSLVVMAFECIIQWIMVPSQWILDTTETRKSLLCAIVLCLTGKKQDEKSGDSTDLPVKGKKAKEKRREERLRDAEKPNTAPVELSTRIKLAAKRTLQTLLNHLGNFPPSSGPASFSSLATEEEILQTLVAKSNGEVSIEDTKHYIRYFITDDDVIICVIDRRYLSDSPSVSIVIRDQTGRYTWDTSLSYLPLNTPEEPPPPSEITAIVPITKLPFDFQTRKTLSVDELSNVIGFFEEKEKQEESAKKIVRQQVTSENELLQSRSYGLDKDIAIYKPSPVDRFIGSCKINQSRMFLSQLGFLSLENRDKLYPLGFSPSLFNLVRQLDQQSERTCVRVGVVYIDKTQAEEEWFGNESGTLDYQEFLATLGWGIDITNHKGFTGTLDVTGNITGRVAPYWANNSTEIIFQVCTLMPNNPTYPDNTHKRKQSLHGQCIVIWVEDFAAFQPQFIWKRLRHSALLICITPMDCDLYHIHLFTKSPEAKISPLVDGMVLRKQILGDMIRATAINAYETFDNVEHTRPCQPRLDAIRKIYNSCKQVDNLEPFYTQQFTEIPTEAVGPLQLLPTKRNRADQNPSPVPLPRRSDDDETKREKRRKKKKRRKVEGEPSEAN